MTKSLFRKELDLLKPYIPGKPVEEVQKEYNIDKIENWHLMKTPWDLH